MNLRICELRIYEFTNLRMVFLVAGHFGGEQRDNLVQQG